MSPSVKSLLHIVGGLLSVAGIVFVGIRLREYAGDIDFSIINHMVWVFGVIAVLVYGCAGILMSQSWRSFVIHFKGEISPVVAMEIYGTTQLAKYVPGNIVHLAGRQAVGVAKGVQGWVLAKATAWDLGISAVAGGVFSILTIPALVPQLHFIWSLLLFVVALIAVTVLAKKIISIHAAYAFLYWAVFLTISGSIFVILLMLLSGDHIAFGFSSLLLYGGAFIAAWLIGLVTPGAPAGVGVRELVLLMVLQNHVPESQLLLVTMLSRLITVAGDVVFFAISLLSIRLNKHA